MKAAVARLLCAACCALWLVAACSSDPATTAWDVVVDVADSLEASDVVPMPEADVAPVAAAAPVADANAADDTGADAAPVAEVDAAPAADAASVADVALIPDVDPLEDVGAADDAAPPDAEGPPDRDAQDAGASDTPDSVFSECEALGIGDAWVGDWSGTIDYDMDTAGLFNPEQGTLESLGTLSFDIACIDSKLVVSGEMVGTAQANGWEPVPFTLEPSFIGADASTFTTLTGIGTAADLSFYGLADSLAAVQMTSLLTEDDVPVPTIAYVSFVKTDGAGEAEGPHSALLREVAAETDALVDDILDAYGKRAALEDTMVVLVSDHGMELQDPSRTSGLGAAVAASGVRVIQTTPGIYHLRTLELEAAVDEVSGTLTVTALDHDDGQPVAGVTLSCDPCEAAAVTAEDGTATLVGAAPATVLAGHPSYNLQTLDVE